MTGGIGLDIGGTRIKAVLCDDRGEIIDRRTSETGDADNAWRPAIREVVAAFERTHGVAAAVGVSCPGIARPDDSGIAWMTGRMTGVVGFDFTAHLSRTTRVPVLNDALAALYGEAWCGAAAGMRDVVLYTLGTGVGGAVMVGGRLLKGHTGRAGHLGHMTVDASGTPDICNTPGSVERAFGNYSLGQRTGGRFTSTDAMLAAAAAGDAPARAAWAESVRCLAAAIVSTLNVLDPECVILGGGMTAAGPALFDALTAQLDLMEWRPFGVAVPVVPARLGEWAGAIGAARNALEQGKA